MRAQTRAPEELVVADTGSADGCASVVPESTPVIDLGRRCGFGSAVAAALAARAAPVSGGSAGQDGGADWPAARATQWVWLLHDDGAPEPAALDELLRAVDVAPSVALAGCKQVDWDDPRRLLEVGFTVAPSGRRVTGLEAGEWDQGQLDHRSDVLAVSTSGLLVRRDVWDALAGTNAALPLFGDDVDLCRRAHLAGHRVVVVPSAVVAHAQAVASGHRTPSCLRVGVGLARRAHALRGQLVHAALPLLPLVGLWLLATCLARAAILLLARRPVVAGTELGAVLLAIGTPWRVFAGRRLAARTRAVPRRSLRALRPPRARSLRSAVESWLPLRDEAPDEAEPDDSPDQPPRAGTADGSTYVPEPGPVADEAVWLPDGGGAVGRALAHPAVLLATVLTAVALTAARALLGSGPLVGQTLAAAPASAQALWRSAFATWSPASLGAPDGGNPLLAVLAGVAWLVGNNPGRAVELLLIGSVPMAGAAAWWAAGTATRSRALRTWAAVAWASAPPLLAATGSGRLGAVLAHVLLPPAAALAARGAGVGRVGRGRVVARRADASPGAAAAAGLVLSVAAAGAPWVLLPALVGVLVLALGGGPRRNRALPAVTALVPAVLLGPRLVALVAAGGWGALAGADPATPALRPWLAALGFAVAPGPWQLPLAWLPGLSLAPWTLTAPLLLAGVLGLTRRGPRGRAAVAAWLVALTALATALGAQRIPGAPPAWPACLSVMLLAVLTAALCGADGLAGRLARVRFGWRQVTAGAVGVAAIAAPVAALTAWAWPGGLAPDGRHPVLHRVDETLLPPIAADLAASPDRSRTLLLAADGNRIDWTLLGQPRPQLGDVPPVAGSAAAGGTAHKAAAITAVSTLLAGVDDARPALMDLGVAAVLLRPSAGVAPSSGLVTQLDDAPGLVRLSSDERGILWRVAPPSGGGLDAPDRAARVRLLTAAGEPVQVLPARAGDTLVSTEVPAAPGLVVLAERADAGWSATLDGRPLAARQHSGWAQAFVKPAGPGHLVVWHHATGEQALAASPPVRAGQLAVVGIALLLCLPVPARLSRGRGTQRTDRRREAG